MLRAGVEDPLAAGVGSAHIAAEDVEILGVVQVDSRAVLAARVDEVDTAQVELGGG